MSPKQRFIRLFEKYQQQFYTGTLFFVAGLLIVLFLPHDVRFPYEFQKGQIWLHADYYAPFDLPLLKQPDELEQEYARIRKQHNKVFTRHDEQDEQVVQALEVRLLAQQNNFSHDNTNQIDALLDLVKRAYQRGIIASDAPQMGSSGELIIVQQNGRETVWPFSHFFTIEALLQHISKKDTSNLWQPGLNALLTPNVVYSEEATTNRIQQQIERVTPYKGLIERGELIVRNGNYIDVGNWERINAYKTAYETGQAGRSKNLLALLGQILLIGMLLLLLYLFLSQNRPHLLEDPGNLAFILFNILFMFGLASLIVSFNPAYIYITPFPILPIVLRSFFDNRVALFVHMLAALIVGLLAPNSFEFITLQFATGMFSIVTISGLYRRAQIFLAAFQISVVYVVIFMGFSLIKETQSDPKTLYTLGHFVLNGMFSLFAFPLIYFFERIFGLVSDITLLELSDTNNPLLRELAEKAPGTFQHSLQVANLAESAVIAISGKPLLVRTGALYHDIGKMNNPLYFIENQTTGVNPHDELSYRESAEIIINHVKKGIQLAKVHKLPDKVIDFIRTHHGTSTVQYFYKQYLKNYPEEADIKSEFAYPGPKPFSKETAVLMMADSVEAASRSLTRPDAEVLDTLVDKIIDGQLADNQLENAEITLREIATVKQVLKKKLLNIYHLRVEYPR
jgi:putative nucleotidyltransferase with HDIG domain